MMALMSVKTSLSRAFRCTNVRSFAVAMRGKSSLNHSRLANRSFASAATQTVGADIFSSRSQERADFANVIVRMREKGHSMLPREILNTFSSWHNEYGILIPRTLVITAAKVFISKQDFQALDQLLALMIENHSSLIGHPGDFSEVYRVILKIFYSSEHFEKQSTNFWSIMTAHVNPMSVFAIDAILEGTTKGGHLMSIKMLRTHFDLLRTLLGNQSTQFAATIISNLQSIAMKNHAVLSAVDKVFQDMMTDLEDMQQSHNEFFDDPSNEDNDLTGRLQLFILNYKSVFRNALEESKLTIEGSEHDANRKKQREIIDNFLDAMSLDNMEAEFGQVLQRNTKENNEKQMSLYEIAVEDFKNSLDWLKGYKQVKAKAGSKSEFDDDQIIQNRLFQTFIREESYKGRSEDVLRTLQLILAKNAQTSDKTRMDSHALMRMVQNIFKVYDGMNLSKLVRTLYSKDDITSYHRKRQQELLAMGEKIRELLHMHDVTTNDKFYESWVVELVPGNKVLSVAANDIDYHHSNMHIDMNHTIAIVEQIVQIALKDLGHDPTLLPIVELMLRHRNEQAVVRTFEILNTIRKEKLKTIDLKIWVNLLNSSTQHLSDVDHKIMTSTISKILASRAQKEVKSIELPRAFFLANCRIGNLYQCLNLFKTMRQHGRITQSDYSVLLKSLPTMRAQSASESRIINHPEQLASWLLQEMKRDGVLLHPRPLSQLVSLFCKPLHTMEPGKQMEEKAKQLAEKAFEFIKLCTTTGHFGHPKVEFSPIVLRSYLDILCAGGLIEEAKAQAGSLTTNYNINSSLFVYSSILQGYAKLGNVDEIERIIQSFVNQKKSMNRDAVEALMKAHITNKDHSAALDCAQDMFNMHKIRPSVGLTLFLLDSFLKSLNIGEARRCVVIIEQIFTEAERKQLLSCATERPILTNIKSLSPLLETGTGKVSFSPDFTSSSEDATVLSKINEFREPNFGQGEYRKRVSFGPMLQGVLSREALRERFLRYGFELDE